MLMAPDVEAGLLVPVELAIIMLDMPIPDILMAPVAEEGVPELIELAVISILAEILCKLLQSCCDLVGIEINESAWRVDCGKQQRGVVPLKYPVVPPAMI